MLLSVFFSLSLVSHNNGRKISANNQSLEGDPFTEINCCAMLKTIK